jgi:Holliday junction resolvase RusA-like endonuclease
LEPFQGTVEITFAFEYKRPKRTTLEIPRADLDNLVKAVLDGLNEVAFVDDKQVALIAASKGWSDRDMIKVSITEFNKGG